jgi:hypothetical protein
VEPTPLPPLPEPVPPESLRELDDAALSAVVDELSATERRIRAAIAPYETQLKELRSRVAEVATEQRRRERGRRHAARVAVRERAGSGEIPSFAEMLAAAETVVPEEQALRETKAFLRTGGEVGFGYPTRPGVVTFTDGRRAAPATTVGEARRLYAEGWEPGTPGLPGIRVHLVGTRIERLVSPDDVVVTPAGAS